MADHRVEQIVDAVVTKITGLPTTGGNVFRGQLYALTDAQLPAIEVYMGPDQKVQTYAQQQIDSDLTIFLVPVVKSSTIQVETLLNQIRKEIAIALQADYTQGLSFVLNTEEGDTARPQLSDAGGVPMATQELTWKCRYRCMRTDPST